MNTLLRFPKGLYGVTPEWDDTDKLLDAISAAAQGGMVALQWRRKKTDADEGLKQARRVAERCRKEGLLFIVNDDWRMASLIDADGVHLGREDGSVAQARMALGSEKIIGCSCYNQPALAAEALKADVDYVAFGAMYASTVKPDAVRATLQDIRRARLLVESSHITPRTAVVAIGGITAHNAADVVNAGADSIALISGLFDTDDIRGTAARCAALFA